MVDAEQAWRRASRRFLAWTLVLALGVSVLFGVPTHGAEAQAAPMGPWVDEVVWAEESDPLRALELMKSDGGDVFIDRLQTPAQKRDAFISPELLTFPAFGFANGLLFNPAEQASGVPWNPFVDREIREAMHWLVDRKLVVQDLESGFAEPFFGPYNPRTADYFREFDTHAALEDQYRPDFARAQTTIAGRMTANGASMGSSGFWEDANGTVIDLQVIARLEDTRRDIGLYIAERLRALGFKVTITLNSFFPALLRVYVDDPRIGQWHVYTEGWTFPHFLWDDDYIHFFFACSFEAFCADISGVGTHRPPADFVSKSLDLSRAQYSNLSERQSWIRDLAPTALRENYRMWLYAQETSFALNDRIESFVYDAFQGPWTPFSLRSTKLLSGQPGVDPVTGTGGRLTVLSPAMFQQAYHPWVDFSFVYDLTLLSSIGDPGMDIHPGTGSFVDLRVETTVETAGPLTDSCSPVGNVSCLPVPSDALVWNLTRDVEGNVTGAGDSFVPVGADAVAYSKVTTSLGNPGKWHTGMEIGMDDVVHSLATAYRRAFGDISKMDSRAVAPDVRFFLSDVLKGFRVVDERTLETYIDFWHVDERVIARTGSWYMGTNIRHAPIPWEIQEAVLHSVLRNDTRIDSQTADEDAKIALDLSRNPASLGALDTAFGEIQAENGGSGRIPPAMIPWITQEEASERYAAAHAFRGTYGHWYASNGPFILTRADPFLLQAELKAFRDGYPLPAGHWDDLALRQVPEISFGSFPSSLLAGTGATLPFTTTVEGIRADPLQTRWFVRELAGSGLILTGEPVRSAVGEFEVQLLSTQTVGLGTGSYELVVIVQGLGGSEVRTFAFTVTSQLDFFSALFDELDDRLDGLSDQTTSLDESLGLVQGSTSSLLTLLTAVLALAVIAIAVPSIMLSRLLRRLRR